jgi:hypothetical protein
MQLMLLNPSTSEKTWLSHLAAWWLQMTRMTPAQLVNLGHQLHPAQLMQVMHRGWRLQWLVLHMQHSPDRRHSWWTVVQATT